MFVQEIGLVHLWPYFITRGWKRRCPTFLARLRRRAFQWHTMAGAPIGRVRMADSNKRMGRPRPQDEIEEIDQIFPGGDPFAYGVEPNQPTLEALVRHRVEQHFVARPIPVDELFMPLPSASGT
jgi:hypothetical protein